MESITSDIPGMAGNPVERRRSRCFVCFPYRDTWLVISQVLSVIAFLLTWMFMGTFIFGVIAVLMQQFLWCTRQSKIGLVILSAVTIFASAFSIFMGALMLYQNSKESSWCIPFNLMMQINNQREDIDIDIDDDFVYDEEYCPDQSYAYVAFFGGIVWLASAAGPIFFITSGRHETWEEEWNEYDRYFNDVSSIKTMEVTAKTAGEEREQDEESVHPMERSDSRKSARSTVDFSDSRKSARSTVDRSDSRKSTKSTRSRSRGRSESRKSARNTMCRSTSRKSARSPTSKSRDRSNSERSTRSTVPKSALFKPPAGVCDMPL